MNILMATNACMSLKAGLTSRPIARQGPVVPMSGLLMHFEGIYGIKTFIAIHFIAFDSRDAGMSQYMTIKISFSGRLVRTAIVFAFKLFVN